MPKAKAKGSYMYVAVCRQGLCHRHHSSQNAHGCHSGSDTTGCLVCPTRHLPEHVNQDLNRHMQKIGQHAFQRQKPHEAWQLRATTSWPSRCSISQPQCSENISRCSAATKSISTPCMKRAKLGGLYIDSAQCRLIQLCTSVQSQSLVST